MGVCIKQFRALFFLFLVAACNGSPTSETPQSIAKTSSSTKIDQVPTDTLSTSNPIRDFDELTKVSVSVQTTLVAAPSVSNSQLATTVVMPGQLVQVVGSDKNGAWLLVLFNNTLGWIPSVYSAVGTGTLNPDMITETPLDSCASFLGAALRINDAWESTISGNVMVNGLIYRSVAEARSENVLITVRIEETGEEYTPALDRINLNTGGDILLFAVSIDNLDQGNHVKFEISDLNNSPPPFQASFLELNCLNSTTGLQANPTVNSRTNLYTPMPTRFVIIQSTSELPPKSDNRTGPSQDGCPGAPPIRVSVNDLARVTYTDGRALRLRSEPKVKSNNIINQLPEGTQIKILDGPVCSDSFTFWFVRVKSNGMKGWVAEGDLSNYFIETLTSP